MTRLIKYYIPKNELLEIFLPISGLHKSQRGWRGSATPMLQNMLR